MIGDNKGFTLVEVLIVALVLAIIIGAGTGIFVSAVKIQKYNLKHQQIFSQISYITEYMNRMIRMAGQGDGICIPEDTSYEILEEDGYSKIKFINYNEECQQFYLDMDYYMSTGQGRILSKTGEQDPVLISSENFNVSLLLFDVIGNSAFDSFQPRVTILIEMTTLELTDQPEIRLQTTISKRNLDI